MQVNCDYRQTLPIAWLRTPDEHDRVNLLEFVRGALYSLSASSLNGGGEVHVSRIRGVFEKIGAPSLQRLGLRLLNLFREAEPLFGGYWAPTPFRVLEVADQRVFIGAMPTTLGSLGKVEYEGLCRLLTPDVAAQFPRQNVENWMGGRPASPNMLIADFVQSHGFKSGLMTHPPGLEFLEFVRIGGGGGRRFYWGQRPISVLAKHSIAVCRQKHAGSYRYFSGDLRSGKVISEAPFEQAVDRLAFALASQAGVPVIASVFAGEASVEIAVAERLPTPEYRLALLLSRQIVRRGAASVFHLAPKLAPALISHLTALGCVLETRK